VLFPRKTGHSFLQLARVSLGDESTPDRAIPPIRNKRQAWGRKADSEMSCHMFFNRHVGSISGIYASGSVMASDDI
jgi:hypothetical protein